MNAIIEVIIIVFISIYVYHYIIMPLVSVNRKNKSQSKVSEIMERDGLNFEDARDKLLAAKIAKVVNVEKDTYEIDQRIIKQGDRISFYNTDENNYMIGDFVGSKVSKAEGYTDHMCIRVEDKILFFPVEVIDTSTLRIYER